MVFVGMLCGQTLIVYAAHDPTLVPVLEKLLLCAMALTLAVEVRKFVWPPSTPEPLNSLSENLDKSCGNPQAEDIPDRGPLQQSKVENPQADDLEGGILEPEMEPQEPQTEGSESADGGSHCARDKINPVWLTLT